MTDIDGRKSALESEKREIVDSQSRSMMNPGMCGFSFLITDVSCSNFSEALTCTATAKTSEMLTY